MADILNDKTNKALISMSVPISIGMLSTFLFQVIDTYFIGQLGASELAALSFSSTVYFLLVGLFIGLSVGVSIIVGQATGSGDRALVHKTTWIGLGLSAALAMVLSALLILFIDPIFRLLGAPDELLPLIRQYTIPLLTGIPLLTAGLLGGGVLRATGNVTKPEVLMAIAGIINLVFDYLLIFGKLGFPALGIKGAAYATILSWVFIIVGMLFLLYQDQLLKLGAQAKSSTAQVLKEIYQLSSPTIVTQIIGPLTLMYLTYLLARQSSLAVAAFGVAGRIEVLLMIGILGVSTAITPFIAQNQGAQQGSRIDEAIAFGGKASTYLGILVALLLFLFIQPIASLFSDDASVINYTTMYFYCVAISYVLYGYFLISTSIFNGLKLTTDSLHISMVKSFAITVPLTLLGSYWGVVGIFVALSLSNVLAGLYAIRRMQASFRKYNSPLAQRNVWADYWADIKRLVGR